MSVDYSKYHKRKVRIVDRSGIQDGGNATMNNTTGILWYDKENNRLIYLSNEGSFSGSEPYLGKQGYKNSWVVFYNDKKVDESVFEFLYDDKDNDDIEEGDTVIILDTPGLRTWARWEICVGKSGIVDKRQSDTYYLIDDNRYFINFTRDMLKLVSKGNKSNNNLKDTKVSEKENKMKVVNLVELSNQDKIKYNKLDNLYKNLFIHNLCNVYGVLNGEAERFILDSMSKEDKDKVLSNVIDIIKSVK